MAFLKSSFLLYVVLTIGFFLQRASGTCYWPDGSLAQKSYVACNLTENGSESACCNKDDPCSTRGLCQGGARFQYRGGYTAKDWSSPNCATLCRSVATKIFANIHPCPTESGLYTSEFCCNHPGARTSCCNTTLNLDALGGTGQFFLPDDDKTTTTTLTRNNSFVTSTLTLSNTGITAAAQARNSASTANPDSDSSRDTVAIGAGIGVPLAILVLMGIGLFLFREHKRRKIAEQRLNDALDFKSILCQTRKPKTVPREGNELHESRGPQELNGQPPGPPELQSNQIHEVVSPL